MSDINKRLSEKMSDEQKYKVIFDLMFEIKLKN